MADEKKFESSADWLIDDPGPLAPIETQYAFITQMLAQFGPDDPITITAQEDLAWRLAHPLPGDPNFADWARDAVKNGELDLTDFRCPGPEARAGALENFLELAHAYLDAGIDVADEVGVAERNLAWRRANPQPGDPGPRE